MKIISSKLFRLDPTLNLQYNLFLDFVIKTHGVEKNKFLCKYALTHTSIESWDLKLPYLLLLFPLIFNVPELFNSFIILAKVPRNRFLEYAEILIDLESK
jgi:hypothetical protein